MHVMMLTWEYPPRIVGGLARHVHGLSRALANRGVRVTVVTAAVAGAPADEQLGPNLRVLRTTLLDLHPYDFQSEIMHLNFAMAGTAMASHVGDPCDIIHAHDWLAAYAAESLRLATHLPLVATIHATEVGRNNGIRTQQQAYISGVEWWLTYQAQRVICCSHYMLDHVHAVFGTPTDKMRVVYNGVDPSRFEVRPPPGFRDRFAAPDEKIALFVGRLVREKGVHVLVEAAPKVLHYHPRTKFVVVGLGDSSMHRRRAAELGLDHAFYFVGFLPDDELPMLYKVADVAVFPSLSEPFGIVALEAMAAGTPLVVSDVGGLREIVRHGENGFRCYPDNPDSLGTQILHVLLDPADAGACARRAGEDVRQRFGWAALADQTAGIYEEVA